VLRVRTHEGNEEMIMPIGQEVDPLESEGRLSFTRSYMWTRLFVGVIGIAMPVVLLALDPLLFGEPSIRGSLSAYYHSGMRDWFVGSLCAIGVGLFTYLGTRLGSFDNWVSTVAGACAIVVAFFPTNTDAGQTPVRLQDQLGEVLVARIHFSFAAIFIALLGLMCLRFGIGDGRRVDRTQTQRRAWRTVHLACACAIWLSVLAVAVILVADIAAPHAILIGEVVAVLAFGISWFCKGSELFSVALGRDRISKLQQVEPVLAA
jgi:hypothetical protein